MKGEDIKKNLQLFIESTWRTLIKEEIEKNIKTYTDVLTWDSIPDTISPDMNDKKYTWHDIARVTRACWKELLELPQRLMSQHDPVIVGKTPKL